jgi:hypothetical protein
MKQGMRGQVEAVYDKLHRMKVAFIYSGVVLRMEIALRAVNPRHAAPVLHPGALHTIIAYE